MANVSAEVLADVMAELQNGKTFPEYIREHNLMGTVRPNELRQQFIAAFGVEMLQNIMRDSMQVRMESRWSTMSSNINNIDRIDQMITSMTNTILQLQARKAELQSSSTAS